MKKLPKFFLVLVLVGTMAVLGLSSSALAADPKVIKIGYTAPFTGAGAEYGTNGWRGIQLALDEVNKKGISIKGEPYKIEIIRYDSICTPTEAVANVRKLAMEDKVVAVLGDHCSSCCMAIAPLLDEFKIAGLTIECAADAVTQPGHEFYFRMRPSMGLMAPLGIPRIVEIFKPKTAGFININDDYGHSFRDSFKAELAKHGVETVVEEDFERGSTDFTVYLTNIKRAKPDVAFYVGAISEGALIVKQANELGVTDKTALFGAEEMAEMELLALAGADAIEGTYAIALWGSVDPVFAKRVQDRFDAPMHYGIIFGYDALHVVAKAIESAQSLDPVKIKDALKKTDYQGLEGHVRFDSFEGYKNQGRFVPSIVKWAGGQRTVVE
jgi:branched-chain amino acid transport system substrate-binding protein